MVKKNNNQETEIFTRFLRQKGLSATRQRTLVLEETFKNHSHFEAEDIVALLKKRDMRVSRATVYRTLVHLQDCGLIRKVDLGHGHSHFEHILGHEHHEHLCCDTCGKILEFQDPALERRIDSIVKQNNFTLSSHTVQIFGICEACSRKNN